MLDNTGIFQMVIKKTTDKNGRIRTKKKYIYLDTIISSSNMDYCLKAKAMLKKYGNMDNIITLAYDSELSAYYTFNTSKNIILLYPIKGIEQ